MLGTLSRAACIAAFSFLPVVLGENFLNNATVPVSQFYTRPDFLSPALNISVSLPGQAPGLIFLGPYVTTYPGSGPRIYDKFGNLVWDGYGVVPGTCHNVHVCQYKGSPHICLSQILDQVGYGAGQAVVLDSNYRVVKTIQTGLNAMPADMHEFQLLNDGETAIMSFYQTVPYDLSAFNETIGLGYLMQGSFQEVNVSSGEVLFEWHSLDHVDPLQTQIQPNTSANSGTGTRGTSGFDYFHINSIDKSPSENYLVSSRHCGIIYYINATDHSTIWQLSFVGKSDFVLQGFNFTWQHDVRMISENETTTIISLFDNAANGFLLTPPSASMSSGQFIAIDHVTGVATLLSITYPPNNTTTLSQGNTQLLPNGNVFHGWGDVPEVSEHDPEGNIIFAASFGNRQLAIESYRGFSFDGWESTPAHTIPSVWGYALNETAPTSIYVSWNGATTVATWRFYGANTTDDPFELLGQTAKNGFETLWEAPTFYRWLRVEAVAADGTGLRNSSFTPTFVPGPQLVAACTVAGCAPLPTAGYINANVSQFVGIS